MHHEPRVQHLRWDSTDENEQALDLMLCFKGYCERGHPVDVESQICHQRHYLVMVKGEES